MGLGNLEKLKYGPNVQVINIFKFNLVSLSFKLVILCDYINSFSYNFFQLIVFGGIGMTTCILGNQGNGQNVQETVGKEERSRQEKFNGRNNLVVNHAMKQLMHKKNFPAMITYVPKKLSTTHVPSMG